MTGWICPKCGAVYAPFVPECARCNNQTVLASTAVLPTGCTCGSTASRGCPIHAWTVEGGTVGSASR